MRTFATLALLLTMSSNPRTPSGQPGPMQPSDYTPAAASRVVSWQLKRVTPPSPLYVSVDDKLVVGAATSQTSEVVTVNYRLLRASDGVIVPGQFTVKPANTRAVTIQQQQLAEGFLLSVSVKAAVATTRGMTFVRAFLGAGPFGAGQPSYMLMADYVTTAMAPAHPNGRVLAPTEGPGWTNIVLVANPAAATAWSLSVPTNARWKVACWTCLLTASASVGNRAVASLVGAQGSTVYLSSAIANQTASQATQYCAAAGTSAVLAPTAGSFQLPLPIDTILSFANGGYVQAFATGLLSTDQFSQIRVQVEEWLENV